MEAHNRSSAQSLPLALGKLPPSQPEKWSQNSTVCLMDTTQDTIQETELWRRGRAVMALLQKLELILADGNQLVLFICECFEVRKWLRYELKMPEFAQKNVVLLDNRGRPW